MDHGGTGVGWMGDGVEVEGTWTLEFACLVTEIRKRKQPKCLFLSGGYIGVKPVKACKRYKFTTAL